VATVAAYRQLELRALVNEPTRKIPAIAEKIKKLQARSDAIRRQLQVPCPTKYGNKEAANDCVRLMQFTSLRDNETALTEAQKAEEAHLRARFDVFSASPEAVARRRREALQDAERRFKKSRLTGDFYAAPLSRKDRNELKLLRWLYPAEPKLNLSGLDDDGLEMRYHPFADELPAPDGNFYPRHSKLRPAAPKEDAEKAHLAANPELLGEATIRELEERRRRPKNYFTAGRVPSRTLGPPFSGSMNPTPLAEGRVARLGALDQFESRQRLSRHPALSCGLS
jgi:hypothetical protein